MNPRAIIIVLVIGICPLVQAEKPVAIPRASKEKVQQTVERGFAGQFQTLDSHQLCRQLLVQPWPGETRPQGASDR